VSNCSAFLGLLHGLEARPCGRGFIARCPAHDDRSPSLSLAQASDGRILLHCFAGCQSTDVIAALRRRGLWFERSLNLNPVKRESQLASWTPERRRQRALDLWLQGEPLRGKIAGIYLVTRGLAVPATERLRHHPAISHPEARQSYPGLLAAFTNENDQFCGLLRIYLARDSCGCVVKAPVDPQKLALGPIGGCSVRLGNVVESKPLVVCEGIETGLACLEATRLPVWAAGSSANLQTLRLPSSVRDVIIAADGDQAGEKAASQAAWRFGCEGRKVRIARPPQGGDFLDLFNAGLSA
jgi:putative DNA primase/helicase